MRWFSNAFSFFSEIVAAPFSVRVMAQKNTFGKF